MKTMTLRAAAVVLLSGLLASPADAQLAAPGSSGVVMGHVHVVGRDLDAHRRFWTALGGTPTKNGTLEMIRFPGAFVNLRQGEPTGGTVGSVIDHFGFQVKRMQDWLPKWQATYSYWPARRSAATRRTPAHRTPSCRVAAV